MKSRNDFYASTRSTEELKERIDNRQNYMPETVEAAMAELQARGHDFSPEELQVISEDMAAQRANANMVSSKIGLFSNEYKNTIITDPDAPLLYSRRAVYLFTVLMGALFGSVMLAVNVSKTEKRSGAIWVLLFGIGFTAMQVAILSALPQNSTLSFQIVCGILSAVCLDFLFWKKLIGYAAFYRARPVWVPLTIAIILVALIVWATIYNTSH